MNLPVQLLQWGRDCLVAESEPAPSRSALAWLASMGPRLFGRGKILPHNPHGWFQTGFNGAATVWSRKAVGVPVTARVKFLLQWGRDCLVAESGFSAASGGWLRGRFNGAATVWSRKESTPHPAAAASPGFNGAATVWSRKVDWQLMQRLHRHRLQWGRDCLVAERRGNLPALKRIDSFNGAATVWSRKG